MESTNPSSRFLQPPRTTHDRLEQPIRTRIPRREGSRRPSCDAFPFQLLRQVEEPVFFVHPTPYNVLGLGHWVKSFKYITHFDSFDGIHHRVMTPRAPADREFKSKEDIVNYLLSHPETHEYIKSLGGRGKMLTVMFDQETEQLAKEAGL